MPRQYFLSLGQDVQEMISCTAALMTCLRRITSQKIRELSRFELGVVCRRFCPEFRRG